jgi:hypothetical protein
MVTVLPLSQSTHVTSPSGLFTKFATLYLLHADIVEPETPAPGICDNGPVPNTVSTVHLP